MQEAIESVASATQPWDPSEFVGQTLLQVQSGSPAVGDGGHGGCEKTAIWRISKAVEKDAKKRGITASPFFGLQEAVRNHGRVDLMTKKVGIENAAHGILIFTKFTYLAV